MKIEYIKHDCEQHATCNSKNEINHITDGETYLHLSTQFQTWKLNETTGVWETDDRIAGFKLYCLGERYMHPGYGISAYGEHYIGSYADGWHSGPQLNTKEEAIEWVKNAKHPQFGCLVWGIE